MNVIQIRNSLHRKSFTFTTNEWAQLKEVALELGYRSRNRFLGETLREIIANHQSKSHNSA